MKDLICIAAGIIGGAIASAFGGWDPLMKALIICMCVDYATGAILALIFHKSPKSEKGGYSSAVGVKGFFKKCGILLGVIICVQADKVMGTNFARDAACVGFALNDTLSVVENLGLMGVPMPEKVTKALEVFKNKEEQK